ncbi:MAG: LysE family translocator [Nocardioidaceae bacterium]
MPSGPVLLAFLATSIVLVVIPGPNVLFLLGRTIGRGRRAGLVSYLGVESATAVYVVATAAGLGAVLARSALALAAVRYAGAAYLLFLGVRAIGSRGAGLGALPTPGRRDYTQGFLVGVSNPKVALFFLAFFPQFVRPDRGSVSLQLLVFGVIFLTIGVLSDGCYVAGAGSVARWLARRPRLSRRQGRFEGTVYIALGAAAIAAGVQTG